LAASAGTGNTYQPTGSRHPLRRAGVTTWGSVVSGGGAPLPSKAHRKRARKFDIPMCLCWFATPSAAAWICGGHVDFIQFCGDFTSRGPHVLIEILPSWDSDP